MNIGPTSPLSRTLIILTAILLLLSLAAVFLAGCAARSAPADNSSAGPAAGLACFSITLPASDGPEIPPPATCDALCATRDAACVGAAFKDSLIAPPLTCGDPSPSPSPTCRCCYIRP
jgi:hypothetical protein